MTADRDQCDCSFRIETIVCLPISSVAATQNKFHCPKANGFKILAKALCS